MARRVRLGDHHRESHRRPAVARIRVLSIGVRDGGAASLNDIAHLAESQREALVLQYWHGWTLAQIAQRLGRTPAAVAGLLKRGLKTLRHELRDEE